MAGSSLKQQRKLGVRTEDGGVIAFPYMPRVADLPPGWRHFSPAQKIEHLLGMSLDDIHEILSWLPWTLDRHPSTLHASAAYVLPGKS